MKSKRWLVIFGVITISLSLALGLFIVVIDPYLHFHAPLEGLEYPFNDPRYVNDGILRHFDYEAMITGTSMSDNFMPSQFTDLWGVKAVKTTFSGATYHELSKNIERALKYNPNLKYIVLSFDPNNLVIAKDAYTYEGRPTYLYDDNVFNDVKYLLNKDVFVESLAVINYTRAGNKTPSPDDYERFDIYHPFGKDAVLSTFIRMEEQNLELSFSETDKETVYENVFENYVKLAEAYPDVIFYFFIPPYSACYWDGLYRTGQVEYTKDAMEFGLSLLLECKNVRAFGFDDCFFVTTDLSRYMDTLHYDREVNRLIIDSMYSGEHELKKDMIEEYYNEILRFYSQFDFDSLYN